MYVVNLILSASYFCSSKKRRLSLNAENHELVDCWGEMNSLSDDVSQRVSAIICMYVV